MMSRTELHGAVGNDANVLYSEENGMYMFVMSKLMTHRLIADKQLFYFTV